MPKARKYSHKRRNRCQNKTKRGGMNTDDLIKMEEGRRYTEGPIPAMYNPQSSNEAVVEQETIISKPNEEVTAAEVFEVPPETFNDEGLYIRGKQRELGKKAANDAANIGSQKYLESVDRLRRLRATENQGLEDTMSEYKRVPKQCELNNSCVISGGRKSKRNRRKGRKSRKHRRTRRH
jgi:hypothetical protein